MLAAGTLAAPRAAHACTCEPTDPQTRYTTADAVFEGRVRAIARLGDPEVGPARLAVTFEVVQTWKAADAEQVVVTTPSDEAACGVRFEVGRSWLVYAASDATGALSTGSCSGTQTREEADENVAALGAGVTPVEVQDAPVRARAAAPGAGGCASCTVAGASPLSGAPLALGLVALLRAARGRSRRRPRARAARGAVSP